ncbi:MAG: sialate O-acetylesterase, partial [Planctomycetota bacterium]
MPAVSIVALLIALLVLSLPAFAADDDSGLSVSDMFSHHMVLQRDAAVPVWGRASAGTTVTVKLEGPEPRKASATAGDDGRWRVDLDALSEPGPYVMIVSAGETRKTFEDVLVGEVWFCSGQSNMEWALAQSADAATDIPAAGDDRLRIYTVPHAYTAAPDDTAGGSWQRATPETVAGFSAVAYYFGKTLREQIGDDTPIGLIESAFGGTPIESWLPREALVASHSDFAQQLVTDETIRERLAENQQSNEDWEQARLAEDPGITKPEWAEFDYDASGWSTMVVPGLWDANGPDIDGAVWFRHTIELTAEQAAEPAKLHLGAIDDFDITWVNGVEVGKTGEEQPNWWQTRRVYDVPANVLREGRNVIVVRIFDQWQGGGFAGVPADMKLVTASGDVSISGLWL